MVSRSLPPVSRFRFALAVLGAAAAVSVPVQSFAQSTQYPISPGTVVTTINPPTPQSATVVTSPPPPAAPPTTSSQATTVAPAAAPVITAANVPAARVLGNTATRQAVAFTGAAGVVPLTVAGAAAVAAGSLFIIVSRRRRTAQPVQFDSSLPR